MLLIVGLRKLKLIFLITMLSGASVQYIIIKKWKKWWDYKATVAHVFHFEGLHILFLLCYVWMWGCALHHGTNTWEGLTKKLHEHEVGNVWMTGSFYGKEWQKKQTINDHEVNVFQKERYFRRAVLEHRTNNAIFLSEQNLSFWGSEEILGSQHNGNFLGLFVLMEKGLCASRIP